MGDRARRDHARSFVAARADRYPALSRGTCMAEAVELTREVLINDEDAFADVSHGDQRSLRLSLA